MAIEAILRNIKLAALEPFDVDVLEIARKHFIPPLAPIKGTGIMLPERLGILNTLIVGLLVLFV